MEYPPIDVVNYLKGEIVLIKPEIILHVISILEVRNLYMDLEAISNILTITEKILKTKIISIIVLTKSDLIFHPRKWPIEKYKNKQKAIEESIHYLIRIRLKIQYRNIGKNPLYKGVIIEKGLYAAAIPVCSLSNEYWNINTLKKVLSSITNGNKEEVVN